MNCSLVNMFTHLLEQCHVHVGGWTPVLFHSDEWGMLFGATLLLLLTVNHRLV